MTRERQSELIKALAACACIPEHELGATVCKRLNKCLSIIRESTPDVTLDEMRARYRMHRRKWPACEVTPESLARWWSTLGGQMRAVPDDSTAIREPAGWRDNATAILGEIDPSTAAYLATRPWHTIPGHIQRAIAGRHMSAPNVVPFRLTG